MGSVTLDKIYHAAYVLKSVARKHRSDQSHQPVDRRRPVPENGKSSGDREF